MYRFAAILSTDLIDTYRSQLKLIYLYPILSFMPFGLLRSFVANRQSSTQVSYI